MKNPVTIKNFFVSIMDRLLFGSGLLKLLLGIFLLGGPVAFAQVGVHTDFPDASSAMDIYATNKGLLIPRVTLTNNLSNPSPVTSPATGLLVFNFGPNQPLGFYYWDGSKWVSTSGTSSNDFWSLLGNAGTTVGTNFIGTLDDEDFALYTNESERMRITEAGNIVIGNTAPYDPADLFTVIGKPGLDYAINAYSPYVGFYAEAGFSGYFSNGGEYGLIALISQDSTSAVYASNSSVNGYGIMTSGSGAPTYTLKNSSSGLASTGNNGIFSFGLSATGSGVIAIGSAGDTAFLIPQGAGGAFTGFHGSYSRARDPLGTGVIGGGNYGPAYTINGGSGGAFTGTHGLISTATNVASGTGVIGIGNNGGYFLSPNGSGGAFTGNHGSISTATNVATGTGVIGIGNNGGYILYPSGSGGAFTGTNLGVAGYGIYGGYLKTTDAAAGTGVIGIGSNGSLALLSSGSGGAFIGSQGVFGKGTNTAGYGVVGIGSNSSGGYPTISNGSGGSFTGYHGLISKGFDATGTGIVGAGNNSGITYLLVGTGGAFSGYHGVYGKGVNIATGTGIIGVGNNISTFPNLYASGSGGAFTGILAGAVGWATDASNGIGMIAAGNNLTPSVPGSGGCGGAFTGTICGVYGYATSSANGTYGGYFSNGGGTSYAYVGYRTPSGVNRKIVGNGTVSTIVKNTKGEIITLVCPEAPESLFQDYGIGQLVDGKSHITIDPDLAININVSEDHPLKVFITLEGDCNGVYVTNKSAQGFDVIELQGGRSNVPFSWQIVATRANEEYVLKDGTMEISDYSKRFQPAPGPLEMIEQPAQSRQLINIETIQIEDVNVEIDDVKIEQTSNEKILQAIDKSEIKPINVPDE